jgi:hypothetical protein
MTEAGVTEATYTLPPRAAGIQRIAIGVGVAGLLLCAAGYAASHEQFLRSYLMAYVFWVGVALGSLAWLMIHHLSGGAWGVVSRRVFEAASRTVPFMALLFLPLAFGVQELYSWARPEVVAEDPILQAKAPYLNVPFFFARAVLYFVIWSALAWTLSAWSRRHDRDGDQGLALRMQRLSGGGLVVYAITILFMSVDWMMSLDPHWFSTIYGVLFMGGQGLSAMAFAIAVLVLLARTEPMSRVVGPGHLHDLGKLLLAFVMLWAYFNFSQFLIIWSGNLPEEIPWYLARLRGGWEWVSLLVVVGHFALPFLLLLNRDLKRTGTTVATIAALIIVMRFVDLFWLVGPGHGQALVSVHWLDLVAPVALGGVWVALFVWQLGTRPLLPLGEPTLHEAIAHGRH